MWNFLWSSWCYRCHSPSERHSVGDRAARSTGERAKTSQRRPSRRSRSTSHTATRGLSPRPCRMTPSSTSSAPRTVSGGRAVCGEQAGVVGAGLAQPAGKPKSTSFGEVCRITFSGTCQDRNVCFTQASIPSCLAAAFLVTVHPLWCSACNSLLTIHSMSCSISIVWLPFLRAALPVLFITIPPGSVPQCLYCLVTIPALCRSAGRSGGRSG